MKIGYIHLFGQEYEDWKKHNRSFHVLVDQLNSEGCDKIYMDTFIPYQDIEAIQQIERIDIKTLFKDIFDSEIYEYQLFILGSAKPGMNKSEYLEKIKNERKGIKLIEVCS
jgi:hypothetical protein